MRSNLTPKDRALIKGALRRVFSRSELRREALQLSVIFHTDPSRPRVKRWGRCVACTKPTALYQMEVDHIEPIVPLHLTLEQMSWDDLVSRLFCGSCNLQVLCKDCHHSKSLSENKQRRLLRKGIRK